MGHLGWVRDHFIFRETMEWFESIEEGGEDFFAGTTFMEFLILIVSNTEQEWILPRVLADRDLWQRNSPNPYKLE